MWSNISSQEMCESVTAETRFFFLQSQLHVKLDNSAKLQLKELNKKIVVYFLQWQSQQNSSHGPRNPP